MTHPSRTLPPNGSTATALFSQLASFLDPIAKSGGLELRSFSVTTFTAMQLAGISIGSDAHKDKTPLEQQQQLLALLVIQTAPIRTLADALREAKGNFEDFFWNYVFERSCIFPMEALAALGDQLEAQLPAVAAAQIEVAIPPSMEGGSEDKPPGNS